MMSCFIFHITSSGSHLRQRGDTIETLAATTSLDTSNPPDAVNSHSSVHSTAVNQLSEALVFLSRHLGQAGEESRLQRLAAEIVRSDGEAFPRMWCRWLISAGRTLGWNLRIADVPKHDLPAVLQSGTVAVADRSALNGEAMSPGAGTVGRIFVLETQAGPESASGSDRVTLVVGEAHSMRPDHRQGHATGHGQGHGSDEGHRRVFPWVALWRLLSPDRKDLWSVVAISGVAGLLMLSVPVTAQHLVRTVTFATLYQPIVVLSLMLLGLLGFVAVLQALQVYVAEIIQRRLFVRVSQQLAYRLSLAEPDIWRQVAMPELVNRFLEIAIVQKVTASILVDGVAIVLTTLIGMSVMAFYHPFLLGYDVMLLLLLSLIIFGFGRNGVKTSIRESVAKYEMLAWLEDLARCPNIFRTSGAELLAMQRSDALCVKYLSARQSHFHILMRQIVMVLILQAVATTALLGLGGFLVLREQLTLGQLVAAELIVATIVTSFAKLGKHLENWYDLMASIDKLSHLMDLPPEPQEGLSGLPDSGPARLEVTRAAHEPLDLEHHASQGHVVLQAEPGQAVSLLNWSPQDLDDLSSSLRGHAAHAGLIVSMDGLKTSELRPDTIRRHAAVVCDLEFLPASVAENIHLLRPGVSEADVRQACEAVGLLEELHASGLSLSSRVLPSGWPLNTKQSRQLILARALAGAPRVLFIDHVLDVFTATEFRALAEGLLRYRSQTTLLLATSRPEFAEQFGNDRPHGRSRQPAGHGENGDEA